MSEETIHLHQSLIRLAKGMIGAWEKWLQSKVNKVRDSGTHVRLDA